MTALLLLSDESWLNATNALLGIVAAVCVIAIGAALFHDIMNRARARSRQRQHFVFDHHSLHVSDLGLTMADGGQPVNHQPESEK